MKKLLLLFFLIFSVNVKANDSQQILSVWGFAVGSTQGVYFRRILESANREQSKYIFMFENKPGAGGAISARYVLDQKKPTILAHSAAFFARPFLYLDNPYNFDQFRPLMIMGFSPAALVTKDKTLSELMSLPRINFSTSGTGSTTHLMAEVFAKHFKNKDIKMVHYSNSNEAYTAVLGGHADATFEFLGDARSKGGTKIIGITGKNKIENFELLRDLGMINYSDLVGIFVIYVKKDMENDLFNELQHILLKAEKATEVQDLYRLDFVSKDPYMYKPGNYSEWYAQTIKRFSDFTRGIEIK